MARIEIRATSAERAAWSETAKASGLTLSALIRQAVSGVKPPRRRKRAEVDPTLLRELARIGNNLNQLARWANRDKKAVEARAVIARLIEIDRELMAIREAHAPRPARNGALEADKEGTRTSDATPSGDGAPC